MYIVVGANGYLGSYIVKNILEKTNENILALARHYDLWEDEERVIWRKCDVANRDDIEHLTFNTKNYENIKIVYLAAYHLPDKVKENPRLAWNINITSLSYFLNAIENIECFFYISTEMVYGNGTKNQLFKESDELKPVNIYGKQKKIAESLVLGYGYNVLRLPFMIGPSILSKKKHFYDVIVETLKEDKVIKMFEDSYKSALDFDTAAATIIDLSKVYSKDMPKILNISGDEILSKYEIGIRIAKKYGLDENLVRPISMNDDNEIFKEKRAECTLLDNSKVKNVLGLTELKIKI